jgi:outer membrane protein assembly factor BamE (lipoprotein component of BamABCDE complex)
MTSGRHIVVSVALATALAISAAGCASQTSKHGHHFTAAEIQQVQPGMSKEQVQLTLGTPDTTATVDGGAYYYIASTTKGAPFLEPKEVDRKVVAIYFNPTGSVERVAHYGLKDGKVFDFINRTTPARGRDNSILKSLFRNLGKGNPLGSNN